MISPSHWLSRVLGAFLLFCTPCPFVLFSEFADEDAVCDCMTMYFFAQLTRMRRPIRTACPGCRVVVSGWPLLWPDTRCLFCILFIIHATISCIIYHLHSCAVWMDCKGRIFNSPYVHQYHNFKSCASLSFRSSPLTHSESFSVINGQLQGDSAKTQFQQTGY